MTNTYKPGTIFNLTDTSVCEPESNLGRFIIVQSDAEIISLISMTNWNRWSDPLKVKDVYKITHYDIKNLIKENSIVAMEVETKNE